MPTKLTEHAFVTTYKVACFHWLKFRYLETTVINQNCIPKQVKEQISFGDTYCCAVHSLEHHIAYHKNQNINIHPTEL